MPVRILNFDDSVTGQRRLLDTFNPSVTDLKKIGPECRLWAGSSAAKKIRAALKPAEKGRITFLGSGDFHHVSSLLIGQFEEPLSVIVFDHHPDWDIMPPRLGCGSWVTDILKRKTIENVVLMGVSSHDISGPSICTANLGSLGGDRLRIYPYEHGPTRVLFRRVPDNSSIEVMRGFPISTIYWHELKREDPGGLFLKVLQGLKVKNVYVSIDKDCLKPAYSLTNWEPGMLELPGLLALLRLIKENCDIAGVDITGDYSAPEAKGRLKTIISRMDHPRDHSAKGKSPSEINSVNQETNIRILELLLHT
ncbi:MAG: hypothetical protein WC317_07190 [Candidatus Omnitrophota bacterium]